MLDELGAAIVPESEKKDSDSRVFAQQLRLIKLADGRIRLAQEDHYRAYEQRSRWIRKHLLGIGDIQGLERRLMDEWTRRFEIMLEGIDSRRHEEKLVRSGRELFQWVELDAPMNETLFVRPEFRAAYMTRGSYHMLADKTKVGWHPEYQNRLGKDNNDAC